jgi:DNA invertase Pin-like site-specific DNA recombinase
LLSWLDFFASTSIEKRGQQASIRRAVMSERKAILYVRQSSAYQVTHNLESQKLQYAMEKHLHQLGWREIKVVDDDLGRSAAGTVVRAGFERMVAEVCLVKVGAVAAREVSRFARNSREWQQLVEVCRIVDTVLIDQETVYAPRQSNGRLLLGLKGSLNEYELDLLRQRSVEARYAKAKRGELVITAPVGYVKSEEQRLEKNPDRRVQEAISLVFRKFRELGTVRQTLLWFLEHELQLPTQTPRGVLFWRRPSYRSVYRLITSPCIQRGPKSTVWRTPSHASEGFGGCHRRSPVGGAANGIPLKIRILPSALTLPSTTPGSVRTCIGGVEAKFTAAVRPRAKTNALRHLISLRMLVSRSSVSLVSGTYSYFPLVPWIRSLEDLFYSILVGPLQPIG